jgi:hypothetical protein
VLAKSFSLTFDLKAAMNQFAILFGWPLHCCAWITNFQTPRLQKSIGLIFSQLPKIRRHTSQLLINEPALRLTSGDFPFGPSRNPTISIFDGTALGRILITVLNATARTKIEKWRECVVPPWRNF